MLVAAGLPEQYSSCFDIGNTVGSALRRYQETDDPYSGSTSPWSAGNGCIMRLAPVPMFYWRDRDATVAYAAESSRTTHGTAECLDACRLFGYVLFKALVGLPRETVLFDNEELVKAGPPLAGKIQATSPRQRLRRRESGGGPMVLFPHGQFSRCHSVGG